MSCARVALAAALVTALAGCGASAPAPGPSLATQQRALAGAPAPLAALHRQAGRLLGGGVKAFRARLVALRGRPVVVNVWGSWCLPCKAEFPIFQRAAVQTGRRVAFLGVDTMDEADKAAAFLRGHPVTYPSYSDPDQAIARALKVTIGVPVTRFYDSRGRLSSFPHAGPYRSVPDLVHDIARYAGADVAPQSGVHG